MARKRKSYREQSVLAYMENGEIYQGAKDRLDYLWSIGQHPEQLRREKQGQRYTYGNRAR